MRAPVLMFLLIYSYPILSQHTIFSDTTILQFGDTNVRYGNLFIEDCSNEIVSISASHLTTGFTYSTNGRAYGYGIKSFDISFQPSIFRVGGISTGFGYGLDLRLTSPNDPLITAMGCDYKDGIYTAGWAIQRFYADLDIANPEDDSLSFRGYLPPEMRAAGGMTYRDGQFYITTENNTLVAVDVENAENSTVVATFPDNGQVLDAMISFPYRCDSIVTYVFGRDTTGTTVYTLDFEDYSLEEYCRLDKKIFAVATPEECIQPPCEMYVDLDEDDSAGLEMNDFQIDTICRSFSGVGDIDTKVFSVLDLDSIVVALTVHPDGLEDQLYAPLSTANITVATRTPFWRYTLINNGGAGFADFEALLKGFSYANIKPDLTYGPRQIFVQAHSNIYSSEPSLMHFYIGDGALELQPQRTAPSCFGAADGAISLHPSGAQPPFTYLWENGHTGDRLGDLAAGAYAITLTAADGCTLQDTLVLEEPDPLVVSLEASSDTICPNSGEVTALVSGGTLPYSYIWDNGATQPTLSGLDGGTYQVDIQDANGCTTMAAATLVDRDTLFTFQEAVACEREVLSIDGVAYTTDTSFCLTYQTALGCDSIHCVSLQFQDTVLVQEQVELCPGEIFVINGLTLSRDTSLCWVNPGSNACDSTYCLSLDILDEPTPLVAEICPGDTYFFAGQQRTEPGLYRDTLPGSRGCDSLIELQLSYLPAPQIDWSTDGSFCTQTSVRIDPGQHSRYQWSNGATTPAIEVTTPGTYELTVENEQGCTATDSLSLSGNDLSFTATLAEPLCAGENSASIMITDIQGGTGPYLYSIDEQAFQANPLFAQLSAGTYRLRLEDAEGCQSEQGITLPDPPAIGLVAPADQSIRLGDTIALEATALASNISTQWSPPQGLRCDSCLLTTAFPTRTTRYLVRVTDANGCQEQAQVLLNVDRRKGFFIPNALSPNDDGVNDRLVIYADASIPNLSELSIYDRWGVMVYQQKTPVPGQEGWDGTYNGQLLPNGVYSYQLTIESVDGVVETVSGEVLLVR